MSNESSSTSGAATTLCPRYADSVSFLRRWRPGGPWLLTAIGLDRTGIETRAFRADQEPEVLRWLEQQGASRNIYFSVNDPFDSYVAQAGAGGKSKKTSDTDIERMVCLHVDIDPRAGEEVTSEQARALGLLTDRLPQGVPPPTVVVFSGGGYQGYWRLREPLKLTGTEAEAEDAKRYNLQLELLFGADHCHNIDRIMRLPGTVNRPDSKKRQKGRTEALSEVISWRDDLVYELAQFGKAPQVQTAGGDVNLVGARQKVKVSGNLRRFGGDVHAIPTAPGMQISDKGKVVIVQGHDPDEPGKYGSSRSEWLFFACCAMVRGGVSDEDIYSVITDPDFAISASVLDKGSATEKYALRQIERAKEEAIDPWLRKLNEKHAVIANWGGRTRVVEEVWDPILKRYRITRQSFDDFRNRYMHEVLRVGTTDKGQPITKPLGQWWLQHPQRRQFDTLVFAPGIEVPGAYNLWRGFACEARPGDCSLFLGHLRDVVCMGDAVLFDYVLGWMARAVQEPASPGYSALVLRGGMGTGKGYVAKVFGSLFGRHFLQVTDPKHLVGSFNAHLRDCVFLFGDEAFYAGDKKHESVLKTLITEELLTVEAKGVDAEASANCVHLMMASNEEWVVPTAMDDRRFLILDVGDIHKEDHGYFESMTTQLKTGGREALLHFLLSYDLRGFNVRKVPKTEALREQQAHSLRGAEAAWFECLVAGEIPCGSVDPATGRARVYSTEFVRWAADLRRGDRVNAHTVAAVLGKPQGNHDRGGKRRGMEFEKRQPTHGGDRRNFWELPALAECRRLWEERRWPVGWSDAAGTWAVSDRLSGFDERA